LHYSESVTLIRRNYLKTSDSGTMDLVTAYTHGRLSNTVG